MYSYILTSVKAGETLVVHHLLESVNAVLVHQLFHLGSTALMALHVCLLQINGAHCCGTNSYRESLKKLIQILVTCYDSKVCSADF